MDSYPCTQCGACCRFAHMIPELPTTADGRTCAHLEEVVDDGGVARFLCGIYETRPDICRIEKHIPPQMTRRAYYEVSVICCEQLQDAVGLAEPYRVKLP